MTGFSCKHFYPIGVHIYQNGKEPINVLTYTCIDILNLITKLSQPNLPFPIGIEPVNFFRIFCM